MTKWIVWAILLLAQNASFTLVSRARNSGSLAYHAVMALFSNGVWFASQLILVGNIVEIIKSADFLRAVAVGIFYVACTMTGSLAAHWLALHKIERLKEDFRMRYGI